MAAEAPLSSQSSAAHAPATPDVAAVTSLAPDQPLAVVASLPLDLLAGIFAFTPRRARLRTISMVCKRWRTAALRSIKTLELLRPGPTNFALLPCLAHLTLQRTIDEVLPTSLRSLFLYGKAIEMLTADGDLLSRHHRNLTELALPHGIGQQQGPLLQFLRNHSTQIVRLQLGPMPAALVEELSLLPWPRLRRLSTHGCPALAHLPTLSALKLLLSIDDFFAVPDQLLPAITSICFNSDMWAPAVLNRLRQCTRLRSLTCRDWHIPDAPLSAHADVLARTITGVMLKDYQSWEWLSQFRALETLVVGPLCVTPSLPAVTFPRLKDALIGDTRPVPAAAGLALAAQILRCFPHVRSLALYLDASAVPHDALVKDVCELITLGASLGLREVSVSVNGGALDWTPPPIVVHGWLTVRGFRQSRV